MGYTNSNMLDTVKAIQSQYQQFFFSGLSKEQEDFVKNTATVLLVDGISQSPGFSGKPGLPTRGDWYVYHEKITIVLSYQPLDNNAKQKILDKIGTTQSISEVYWSFGNSAIAPFGILARKGWNCYLCTNSEYVIWPNNENAILNHRAINIRDLLNKQDPVENQIGHNGDIKKIATIVQKVAAIKVYNPDSAHAALLQRKDDLSVITLVMGADLTDTQKTKLISQLGTNFTSNEIYWGDEIIKDYLNEGWLGWRILEKEGVKAIFYPTNESTIIEEKTIFVEA